MKFGAATLAGMLAGGCHLPRPQLEPSAPRRVQIVLRPAIQQPVEVSEADFRAAMRSLTADAGILRAQAPKPSLVRLASLDEQAQAFSRELNDDDARQALALDVALSGAMTEAADALGAITPLQLRVMVMSAMVGYMALILIPEPISKLIAIVLTCNMIAYLGLDLFNSVVQGYRQMRDKARAARSTEELVQAGQRFGERLGPSAARLIVMLATFGLARASGVTPAGPPRLPGAFRAAATAEAHGYSLAAVAEVQAVTRAVDGSVTLTLTGSAAMSSVTSGGSTGAPGSQSILPTPTVSDQKLQNIIDNLYKGTKNPKRIGTGTTADAIRHELATGQPSAGKWHIQKGEESVRALENWIKQNPNASPSDRLKAQSLRDELLDALRGKP